MSATWLVARAHLRRHWASAVLVVLLVAVSGAAVLATVDGVRRTRSAVERFDEATASANAFVQLPVDDEGGTDPRQVEQVNSLSEVEAAAPTVSLAMIPADLELPPGREVQLVATAGVDDRLGRDVMRPRIIDGRRARPERVEEVVLNEDMAAALGVTAGDSVPFVSFTPEQAAEFEATGTAPERPDGPRVELKVVGIGRTSSDLPQGENLDNFPVLLTPTFYETYRDEIAGFGGFLLVRLHSSADAGAFARSFGEAVGPEAEVLGGPDDVGTPGVEQAIDTESLALLSFAGVIGVTTLVATAQAFGRQAATSAPDQATLRALGLSPSARVAAAAVAMLPVALGGSALAVVGAVAASPLLPIGLARRAEPDPGVHVDSLVLLVGGLGIIGIVLVLATATSWRGSGFATVPSSAREAERPTRGVAWGRRLAALSPVASTGVRMALQSGRGRSAVPVRSALVGAVVGVVGVVAALVMGASLDRLVESPDRYGWNWDVAVAAGSEPDVAARIADGLVSDPDVAAVATVDSAFMDVEGVEMRGVGFSAVAGAIEPTVVDGRAPRAADEIALGTDFADQLGAAIGDTVTIGRGDRQQAFRVVGRVVTPLDPTEPARGVVFAGDLRRVATPPGSDEGLVEAIAPSSDVVVRFAPGVDQDAAIERLQDDGFVVSTAQRPVDVDTLASVKALPFVLAAVLGGLAVLALTHALITSVRRRRHDLAVLETLGFVRRQVRGVVAWQATTVAALGVILGVPLGLAAGRWGWAVLADGIGMATDPDVRVLALVLVVLLTPVLANVIAALPARAATRTRPASVLRAE